MANQKREDRLSLSVPQPCEARWSDMNPEQGGRHCGQCQTKVWDLTSVKPEEMQQFLAQHRPKCVRMLVDHEQSCDQQQITKAKTQDHTSKWLAAASVLAMMNTGFAQTVAPTPVDHPVVEDRPAELSVVKVRGCVVDSLTGEPIWPAMVYYQAFNIGYVTDTLGRFELAIPDSCWNPTIELTAYMVGYAKRNLTLTKEDASNDIRIALPMLEINIVIGQLETPKRKHLRVRRSDKVRPMSSGK
jgi:hypothetical protein